MPSDDAPPGDDTLNRETPTTGDILADHTRPDDGPLADADDVGVIEGRPDYTETEPSMCFREPCRACGADVDVPVPSPETTAIAQECRECGTDNWFRVSEVRIPRP